MTPEAPPAQGTGGNPLLDVALQNAARVRAIFPVMPRGKTPLTHHGCKDATTDERKIRAWWSRWPDANIGIATGGVSRFWVLDVDPRHGGDDSLRALENAHGPLPETVECLTGGGGRHLYFTHPGQPVPCSTDKIGPGLDVRGDGGYVVCPPSLHENGRRYEWELSHLPEETPLAAAPGWLLELNQPTPSPTPRPAPASPLSEIILSGHRHPALVSLAGTLRRRGLVAEEILPCLLAFNARRCRPPKPPEEVEKIARDIPGRYEAGAPIVGTLHRPASPLPAKAIALLRGGRR